MEKTEKAETKKVSKRRAVRFCPKCGSTGIYWARGLPQLWSMWECRNCGYYGALIVEDGMMSKKLQEEYAKKLKESNRDEVSASHASSSA